MKKLGCILLIDDDEATNNLSKMIFSRLDLCDKIEVAENGKEGIDYISNCTEDDLPDLILLDINMPLMNGFEFLEEYQKLPEDRKNSVTLLMLTTSQNPDDMARANSFKELAGFINKPMTKGRVEEIWSNYVK